MKKNISKLLFLLSFILVVIFIILIIIDYLNYDFLINSAPFSALILVRLIEFIVPSIIIFGIGVVLKKSKY